MLYVVDKVLMSTCLYRSSLCVEPYLKILSTVECNFLINATAMCVKLAMSTVGSGGGDTAHEFSPSQNGIISDMPTSLSAALKRFGADGRFELYTTWCAYLDTGQTLSSAMAPSGWTILVHLPGRSGHS